MERLRKIPENREALFALTFAAIIFGANAPITKWTLQSGSIETLAFLRFFIAFLFITILFKPNFKVHKKDIPLMLFCGIIGISLHISLYYTGLSLTSAVNAAIIASSIPILTLFFSKFFLNEKISSKFLLGGITGLFGVFFIIIRPILESGISLHFLGNILLFGSAFSFILYEIISKKLTKRNYHTKTVASYSYLIGALTFFPFFMIDITSNGINFINPKFLMGLSFIILFPSLIALPLWHWAVSKLEVSRVGFFLYLDPVIASVVAVFLLGEIITSSMLIGALFIFIGLYIAENTIHFPHFHLYHAQIRRKRKGES